MGIPQNAYANPEGITFLEVAIASLLSKLTVKLLPIAFIKYASAPPKSQQAD